MLVSPSGLIAYARTEEAQKKLRYAGVSVVFLPVGQGLIQVLGLWLHDYTTATLLAYAIATVPGFFVYKRFVWRDMSRENLHRQVLVFWATMMLTVSLATLFTYLVQNAMADQTVPVRGAAVSAPRCLALASSGLAATSCWTGGCRRDPKYQMSIRTSCQCRFGGRRCGDGACRSAASRSPLAARHAHQRPHMLQQRPGVVAETLRPQPATIGPARPGRQVSGRSASAGPSRGPSRWWPPPDPESCPYPPLTPSSAGSEVCSLPAAARPCRSCPPHRASLPIHALKIDEAPPPATRSKLVRHAVVLTPGFPTCSCRESLDTGEAGVADRAAYRCKEEENNNRRAFHRPC